MTQKHVSLTKVATMLHEPVKSQKKGRVRFTACSDEYNYVQFPNDLEVPKNNHVAS
jgi:hypothetical protein